MIPRAPTRGIPNCPPLILTAHPAPSASPHSPEPSAPTHSPTAPPSSPAPPDPRSPATPAPAPLVTPPAPTQAVHPPPLVPVSPASSPKTASRNPLTRKEHLFYSIPKRHVWQRARAWAADHRARAGYPSPTLGAGSRLCGSAERHGRSHRLIVYLLFFIPWFNSCLLLSLGEALRCEPLVSTWGQASIPRTHRESDAGLGSAQELPARPQTVTLGSIRGLTRTRVIAFREHADAPHPSRA